MARFLPEVMEHFPSLDSRSRKVAKDVSNFVSANKMQRVHLYVDDYERIRSALRVSGFDVARGFRISGVKIVRYDG